MPVAMGDDLPNAVGNTEETADLATPENIPLAPERESKKRLRFGAAGAAGATGMTAAASSANEPGGGICPFV